MDLRYTGIPHSWTNPNFLQDAEQLWLPGVLVASFFEDVIDSSGPRFIKSLHSNHPRSLNIGLIGGFCFRSPPNLDLSALQRCVHNSFNSINWVTCKIQQSTSMTYAPFPVQDKRSGYTLLHGHVHLGKRKLMINHWTRTYMTTITIWHSNTIITIIKTTIIIILSLTLSYCFTITCCYYWLFTSVVPCFFSHCFPPFFQETQCIGIFKILGDLRLRRALDLWSSPGSSLSALWRGPSRDHTPRRSQPRENKALQLEMRWASLQIHCIYI